MTLVPLKDMEQLEHLGRIAPDGIATFSLGTIEGPPGGEIRGFIVNGTRMISQMRANHRLGIPETLVLGHAYLGAALMASSQRDGDRVLLAVSCEGPAEGFHVDARRVAGDGDRGSGVAVRGRIFNSSIVLDRPPESFDTAAFVGAGSITVTRQLEGNGQAFTGTTALHSGRLSQDLAVYYLESEQTHSAFRLGIQFDRSGRVAGAAGIFLQALPKALATTCDEAERKLALMPSPAAWIAQGGECMDLVERHLSLLDPVSLGSMDVSFFCPCSREGIGGFLESADRSFLEELVETGPWPVETICHNCGSVHSFDRDEVEAMLLRSRNSPAPVDIA
jgi:molecular chaperone Hsp33